MNQTSLSSYVSTASKGFSNSEDLQTTFRKIQDALPERLVRVLCLGHSEQNQPIHSIIIGEGPKKVSVLSGSHADEPVGYDTIITFLNIIAQNSEDFQVWLTQYTFVIVPDINPDGRKQNERWRKAWPDWKAYVRHTVRELPGRDLEFGYPDMRVENQILARFYETQGPFHLHLNLHGMGFAEGGLLLINREHVAETAGLQQRFINLVLQHGLPLHDHNRKGEKGFMYIGPGLSTTPESKPMQAFFLEQNDTETASLFHQTSMEFISNLGGRPLCLVSELPLFLLIKPGHTHQPGEPAIYKSFRDILVSVRKDLERNASVKPKLNGIEILPLDLEKAVAIQLDLLQIALEEWVDKTPA